MCGTHDCMDPLGLKICALQKTKKTRRPQATVHDTIPPYTLESVYFQLVAPEDPPLVDIAYSLDGDLAIKTSVEEVVCHVSMTVEAARPSVHAVIHFVDQLREWLDAPVMAPIMAPTSPAASQGDTSASSSSQTHRYVFLSASWFPYR